jgi:DNA repair protein RadD
MTSSTLGPRTGGVRLRPYQLEAIHRVRALAAQGVKRIVIALPTGGGKTTIAARIIEESLDQGRRVLFLAHRRELITQAYRRLLDVGITEQQVGVIMAADPRRRPGAAVQVASVDTLRNRPKPRADVIFVDECHRAMAASYVHIAAAYPDALHLGLTATPYRADGRGLGDAYDEIVVVATPRQLIEDGFLVEPRIFTMSPDQMPDLSRVKVDRGDYAAGELDRAMNRQTLVGNIVEHWHEHAAGLRTVTFASSIAHSRHIVERFVAAGVAAEHLDGTTPSIERDAILRRLETAETLVVSNMGVLCEGWDQPSVKCAILARPTKSTGLYLQQAGRILRPWNDHQAIILDHAGCALEHGLPQDTRRFALHAEKRKRQGKAGEAPARVCESCLMVVPLSVRACPNCGTEFQRVELLGEAEGKLVEITPEQRKHLEWERLLSVASERGYKSGWAYHRFREQFDEDPPKGVQQTAPTPRHSDVERMLRDAARRGSFSWDDLASLTGAG